MLIRILPLAFLAALVGCSSPHPPRGPDYTPENSPEAESPCPDEWKAAVEARERLLDDDSPGAREASAAAVYAQAECEHGRFTSSAVPASAYDELLERVRELSRAHHSVANLYIEVEGREGSALKIAAKARRGALHARFAEVLAGLPTPTDMSEPGERSGFRAEVSELAHTFEAKAVQALSAALDRSEMLRANTELAPLVEKSCSVLAELAPADAARRCADRN